MTADNYTPATALSGYYTSRSERSPARHWAVEKLIHDAAAIGQLSFFEGPGPNPMSLSGASTAKLWLDTDAGVTATSGTLKYYKGSGASSDEDNWLALTPAAYLAHLGGLSAVTAAEDFATKAAATAASISSAVTYIRIAGYTTAGDLGGALYKKVGSAPAHGAKIQSADGAWWEIAETVVTPYMLGAKPDGTTQTTAMQAWLDVVRLWTGGSQFAPHLHLPRGEWVTGRLVYPEYMTLFGTNRRSSRIKLANGINDHLFVPYGWANSSTAPQYPVDIRGIAFDGNKANQSSDKHCLVYSSFKGTVADCLFINASRHGVLCTTKNEAGTDLLAGIADSLFMNNRYETCDGSGWYGEDGNNTLSDIMFINDIFASCGSETYAQLHVDRSAGFVLNQVRTYGGGARYDVNLLKAGRTAIIGGNFDYRAIGLSTSSAVGAAIRMQTAGLVGQSHNQIVGAQITLAVELVDNGVTAYHGVYMDGGSNDLAIVGCNFAAHATVANGRPVSITAESYGVFESAISDAHPWPEAVSISRLESKRFVSTKTNGETLRLDNYATLAAFDNAFIRIYRAPDSGGTMTTFVRELYGPADVTDGSEDGFYGVDTIVAGTTAALLRGRQQSIIVGNATSGDAYTNAGSVSLKRLYFDGSRFASAGSGSPEGVLSAPIGSTYHRTDGGAGTSFYVKESGTGNTGWVAK